MKGPTAEGDDGPRSQQRELAREVRSTCPCGVDPEPVGRRTALQHVDDPVLGRVEAELLDGPIELAAGSPHERLSGPIFLRSGGFSNEDHPGVIPSPIEDHVGAPRVKRAKHALADLLGECLPLGPDRARHFHSATLHNYRRGLMILEVPASGAEAYLNSSA